ncbi:hypothetical protein HMPREF9372_0918 [Sporosarcina newyorkensis 2681]|uniref:Uncharacterized protein n=1 Tax=Sporosarcina newyorkensis 2681 TaxID=1027292 RepID=F9DQ38_9BACL|nr:hypothetical protein HMPREF9372_0918 [Sporosarcina newyorkensis 2681]
MVKRDWIAILDKFMKDIQDWLNQKERGGAVKIVRDEIEIIEEHLGKYQAPRLQILIA